MATALKLKELGYSYVQFSGASYDADKIARVSKASEMPICLTHVPMDRIIGETEKLMEEHTKFGCKNIGLGMMPLQTLVDNEAFKKTVEDLNRAGELMQRNGSRAEICARRRRHDRICARCQENAGIRRKILFGRAG